jgi:phosphocarrier protein
MTSYQREVKVVNLRGLHARASARLAKHAAEFQSAITVSKEGSSVTATSIMGLMMLGAGIGDTITISSDGSDREAAVDAIVALVTDRFGEGE